MNDPRKLKRLLGDVLEEGNAPGFREQLLTETLRLARRRRRFRHAGRAGMGIATLALMTLLAWRGLHRVPVSGPLEERKPYMLVSTESLPASAVVETRPLSQAQEVASFATRNVVSTSNALAVRPKEVSDDELLALCSPRPAVLVRQGPQSAELVFLDNTP
jgi:hypothetical protein